MRAGASTVALTLRLEDGAVHVEVRDDGRGFDASQSKPGLGLASIADRVSQVNGRWAIESEPGRGTVVWFDLPLVDGSDRETPESQSKTG